MNALKKELRTVFSSKTAGNRVKRMLLDDISPWNADAVEVNGFGANTETEHTSSKKRSVQRLEFCDIQNTENLRPLEVTTGDTYTKVGPAARVGTGNNYTAEIVSTTKCINWWFCHWFNIPKKSKRFIPSISLSNWWFFITRLSLSSLYYASISANSLDYIYRAGK